MKTKPMLMLALLLNVLLGQQVQAFYNPSTGRWLSRDPHFELGFDGDWPTEDSYRGQDSVTIHAYVGNNPVNFIDATGLFSIEDILGMALNPPCGSVSVQGKLKLVSWHVTGIGIGNKLACNGVRALLRGKINEALNKLPYSNDYACKNRNCVSVASFGPLNFPFSPKVPFKFAVDLTGDIAPPATPKCKVDLELSGTVTVSGTIGYCGCSN